MVISLYTISWNSHDFFEKWPVAGGLVYISPHIYYLYLPVYKASQFSLIYTDKYMIGIHSCSNPLHIIPILLFRLTVCAYKALYWN
jgi:hypothetical protein